jgi:hypothetical protein
MQVSVRGDILYGIDRGMGMGHTLPMIKERLRPHDPIRFHQKYEVRGPDECWPWKSCFKYRNGIPTYGHFNVGSCKALKAHRVAYYLARGPFDESLHVLHSCDNPRCVNPAHLWLGDNNANIMDKVRKGRARGRTALSTVKFNPTVRGDL